MLRGKQVLLMGVVVALLCAVNMVIVGSQFRQIKSSYLLAVVGQTIFTHYPIGIAAIFYLSLTQRLFVMERHTRSLESLLATPLHPWSIWLGKCLVCFVFGWGGSVLASVASWLAFSAAVGQVVAPGTGAIVFFLTLAPIVSGGVVLLLGVANLTVRNTIVANTAMIYLGGGYLALSSFRAKQMILSWQSIVVFLAAAVATYALAFALAARMSAEDMILAEYKPVPEVKASASG